MDRINLKMAKKDYGVLGLRDNPFPYTGVPENAPEVYYDQVEVINAVNNLLDIIISTGKSNHLIITGAYGNGKSHTLRYIQSEITTLSANHEVKVCVGYVSQPGESFLDIYREFIYDIGYDFLKKKSQEYIVYVASELIKNKKIKTKIKKNLSWERIESGDILLADVIPYAVKLLNETTKYMDFTRAFINLSYDEMSMHAWEWISGEGTDHYKRREIGISNNIMPNSALKAFLSLKKTLNQLGYNAIIILLDEFEAIELLQISLKQKLLNNIRHLIDTNPFGLSMIIACAPEVWRILLSEYHAFSERIIKEVNLKPMGKKHVEELISLYLDTARYDGGKGIKPFTKASIDNVYQMSQGNIRRIVSICGRILDVAVKQEKKLIDANCFREFQIPLNNKTIKNVL